MPICRRARRSCSGSSVVTSTPSSLTEPASGSTSRFTQRISVLLPAPEAPMTNTMSCAATVSETPRSASSPVGYRLLRPLTSSTRPEPRLLPALPRRLGQLLVVGGIARERGAVGLENADDALPVALVADRHEHRDVAELLPDTRARHLER